MSELLATRVTEAMLNGYTAESGGSYRMPAAWQRAFCKAVGSIMLLQAIVEADGCKLIGPEEADLLELGREFLKQRRASDNVSLLEKRLQGVEL